jgi:hypothetical protein
MLAKLADAAATTGLGNVGEQQQQQQKQQQQQQQGGGGVLS